MSTGSYPPTLFVLGTEQNVGKTTSCMGVISRLLGPPFNFLPSEVGYIKPVGQHATLAREADGDPIQIDADAFLISGLYGLRVEPLKALSPVVWSVGATAAFIDEAAENGVRGLRARLRASVRRAYDTVADGKKIVVCEGTGQSGVGSVSGLSNGEVIHVLQEMGAPVITILVTRGGIGSTIDRFFPHILSLVYLGCRVDGLIVTAVRLDKLPKIEDYLSRYYGSLFPQLYDPVAECCSGPRILGLIPEVKELGLPTMRLLADTFAAEHIDPVGFLAPHIENEGADLFVRRVKVRSLERWDEAYLEDGDLFIVGANANGAIVELLATDARRKAEGREGLSGLILSCSKMSILSTAAFDAVLKAKIPTIMLPYDSADIVRRLSELRVKIQPYDRFKKESIERIYGEYLDLSSISDRLMHHSGARGEVASHGNSGDPGR